MGKKLESPVNMGILKRCPRLSEEERAQMTELAVEMNRNYFAGMTKPEKEVKDTEGWKLWKEKGAELFFGKYMDSMLVDAGCDENKLKIVRDLRP